MKFPQCDFKRSTGTWDKDQKTYTAETWQCSRSGCCDFEEFYDEKLHKFKLCKQHFKIASKHEN